MLVTTDLAADDPERFKLARDGDHDVALPV
jgi:hypothetical protein